MYRKYGEQDLNTSSLERVPHYRGFVLERVSNFREFSLERVPNYRGFVLERVHCTNNCA